jgi:hypothetical protein
MTKDEKISCWFGIIIGAESTIIIALLYLGIFTDWRI